MRFGFGASIAEPITAHYLVITSHCSGILISQDLSSYPGVFNRDVAVSREAHGLLVSLRQWREIQKSAEVAKGERRRKKMRNRGNPRGWQRNQQGVSASETRTLICIPVIINPTICMNACV